MSLATELTLVRHGEAVVNLTGSIDGVCHGLTDRGRAQAELLAKRFKEQAANGRGFDVAYHSPRRRCAETARILQPAIGVPFIEHPGLRDPDFGEPGAERWDVEHNAIGTIPTFAPDLPPTPGAEPWQSYLDRCGQVLLDLVATHVGQRVLVVAHAETAGGAAQAFLRLPPGNSRWFYPVIHHTALTVWRHSFSDLPGADPVGLWALAAANDTGHLAPGEFLDYTG